MGCSIYYRFDWFKWKETKQNQQKEKGNVVVCKEPGTKFQEFPPRGITQDMLNSHSNKLWQLMSNACLPGKLIRDSAPREHIGCYYRHFTTFQTSRKKAGVQHESYCLYEESGYSEPLFSVQGMVVTFQKFKLSDDYVVNLASRSFLMRAVSNLLC